MFTVSEKHFVYAMSKDNPAVLTVPSGSELVFETKDALDGQVSSDGQSIDSLNWERVNPATGPIAIEGAMPGDVLKISIKRIEATGNGVMSAISGLGVFGDSIKQSSLKVMPVSDDGIPFDANIRLPYRPMVGVIGVAPAGEAIPCGTPGSHGGNMDCKEISPGNILYLPVFHPGGLLAMGDVHACMGDGEIMGTGVEVPAKVCVTVEIVKGLDIQDPLLETADMLYSVASDDTLENATKKAVSNIREMVATKLKMDLDTTGMLLSAIGELKVCQVVDPLMTVRFGMPKEYVF